MIEFVERVRDLVRAGDIRISEHGYEELVEDRLTVREVLAGVQEAIVVEEYLTYPKGPCVLLLQKDQMGGPIHVVWGIPGGYDKPAVLNKCSESVYKCDLFVMPGLTRHPV